MPPPPPDRPQPLPDVYDPTAVPFGADPDGTDLAAGGADSSPLETEPSDRRTEVADHERDLGRAPGTDPLGE